MKEQKKCCHCGTTENVNLWVYWIDDHDLCKSCKHKYDTLTVNHRIELARFFSKATRVERDIVYE